MTYKQALQYLNSFVNYEHSDCYDYNRSLGLDRIKTLASLLGNPQNGIRSIHIAGSKGKGSTAAIVQSILKTAGYRVGLYTSPHLVSFTERIRIDDSMIPEKDVARLMERVKTAVGRMNKDNPSFFEVYTALCFLYFKEKKVDFAVYEVGLGGRLDATNIVEPLVTAITPISYEHTDKLGKTLKRIAVEKAGIIKEGITCVAAPQSGEALEAIGRIAKQKQARLILVGRDIRFREIKSKEEREVFAVSGIIGDYPFLETRLLGSHQIVNAATAVGIVEALRFAGFIISPDVIRQGILSARWAGRLEVVGRRPYIVLDGAQNRASANALVKAVRKIFRYKRLILIFGVSKDKDVKGVLSELLTMADYMILTRSRITGRAMEPARIKEYIDKKIPVLLTTGVEDALKAAFDKARPEDMILVTGSLFVVGEVRGRFYPIDVAGRVIETPELFERGVK